MPPIKNPVEVSILGPDKHSKTLKVVPHRIKVKTTNEEVVWTARGGDIEVDFNYAEGSPFASTNFTATDGNSVSSGTAINLTQPKVYRYTLTISRPGFNDITIDPEVGMDDSGPPGPHMKPHGKKAAKKKGTSKKGARKSASKKSGKKKKK